MENLLKFCLASFLISVSFQDAPGLGGLSPLSYDDQAKKNGAGAPRRYMFVYIYKQLWHTRRD